MVHYEAHTFGSFGNCTYGGDDMRSNPGTPTLNTMERPLSTDTKSTTALHDPPVPVRAKLAAAWASLMFLYIYVSMYNAAGESWTYSYFYGLSIGLELLLLAFILRSAWTWPRTPAPSMPEPAAPRRSQIQLGR